MHARFLWRSSPLYGEPNERLRSIQFNVATANETTR